MKNLSALLPVVLLAMLLLALRLPAAAQAPAWQAARAVAAATTAATNNYSYVTATAVDAVGNVYLAGSFTNMVALGGTTLNSLGNADVFVAKFSPASNQFVWAQRAGGLVDDFVTSLAVSGTSVYMAGNFTSPTATFGPTTLSNAGSTDVFVAKLTDAGGIGSFVWAQRAGGTGNEYATALSVSGTSVYVAGGFIGSAAGFGPITLVSAGNTGSADVFVAKLTDAGNTGSFAWAQRAGGANGDQASALAVSGPSVYVTGYFNGPTAGFGPITLANSGGTNVFVAKLTDAGPTGSFVWAQQAGGTETDYAGALAASGSSVYVAGYFQGSTASFGPTILTNAGSFFNSDMFVAKLTDAGGAGSFVWAQRAGGTSDDQASALAVIGPNVYVAGAFRSSTAGFGSTTLTNAGTAGIDEVFVAKLTDAGSTGVFEWAQRAGGTGTDLAGALAVSGNNVHVGGYFAGPATGFGPITLTNPNSGTLGFLASLTDPTLTATATSRTLSPAQLFPNPAHHAATLRLPADTAPAPLVLTDALGRAVRRYPAPAGPEATLDLQGLPAGLYLLRGAGPARRLAVE